MLFSAFDPYAPPAVAPRQRERGHWRGRFFTWVFLAIETVRIGFLALIHAGLVAGDHRALDQALLFIGLGAAGTGLLWLYSACAALPPADLDDANLSPASAVGYLFVPLFGMIWMFMVHLRLCNATDAALARVGLEPRRCHAVAMLAAAVQIGASAVAIVDRFPLLALGANVARAAAWLLYMFMLDAAIGAFKGARP